MNNYIHFCIDSSFDHKFDFNEGISLVVTCAGQAEIDRYWEELTADGGMEGRCGWWADKYGVHWQIVPAGMGSFFRSAKSTKNVMAAVLTTTKLDFSHRGCRTAGRSLTAQVVR